MTKRSEKVLADCFMSNHLKSTFNIFHFGMWLSVPHDRGVKYNAAGYFRSQDAMSG